VSAQLAGKDSEISKLHEEIQFLEDQGEQFIKKLEEK
jgi:hypothetical protein